MIYTKKKKRFFNSSQISTTKGGVSRTRKELLNLTLRRLRKS